MKDHHIGKTKDILKIFEDFFHQHYFIKYCRPMLKSNTAAHLLDLLGRIHEGFLKGMYTLKS